MIHRKIESERDEEIGGEGSEKRKKKKKKRKKRMHTRERASIGCIDAKSFLG